MHQSTFLPCENLLDNQSNSDSDLSICLAVLHEAKDDVTALHCKVVCLVQNSSFKEALNLMNNYSKLLGKYVDDHLKIGVVVC